MDKETEKQREERERAKGSGETPPRDKPVQPPPTPPGKTPPSPTPPPKKAKAGHEGEEPDAEPETDLERLRTIGSPLRDDDRMNFFRAPDNKAVGTFFGEDMDQPKLETPEEEEIPVETHPQIPDGGDGGWIVQKKVEGTASRRA